MAALPLWNANDIKKILKQEFLYPGERYRIDVVLEEEDDPEEFVFELWRDSLQILLFGNREEEYPGAYYLGSKLGASVQSIYEYLDLWNTQGTLDPDAVADFIVFVKFPSLLLRDDMHPIQKNNILHYWAGFLSYRNVDAESFDQNVKEIERLAPLYYPNAYTVVIRDEGDPGKYEDYGSAQIAAALHKSNGDVAKAAALLRVT